MNNLLTIDSRRTTRHQFASVKESSQVCVTL